MSPLPKFDMLLSRL